MTTAANDSLGKSVEPSSNSTNTSGGSEFTHNIKDEKELEKLNQKIQNYFDQDQQTSKENGQVA